MRKLVLVHVQLIRNRRMRRRHIGLYGPIDGRGEGCHGLDTDLDLKKDPAVGSPGVAREMDLRFLTLDCEIENMAFKTMSWTSNHNASSSTSSDPVSSTVREYIRQFSSEGVSTLPTSAMWSYVPSRIHWDVQTQEYLMPSLWTSASRISENLSLEQRVETGVQTEASIQSPSMINNEHLSRKALRKLGILQD